MSLCGVPFPRLADGLWVTCDLPSGHNCAHSWKDPALTKSVPSITSKPAARKTKGKRRAARKEAPVSPQSEALNLPAGYRFERRPTCHPTNDGPTEVRDPEGRVLALADPPPSVWLSGWVN